MKVGLAVLVATWAMAVANPVRATSPDDSTTTTTTTATTTGSELSEAVIPPITEGGAPGAWQGVQSHRRPLAYDVPGSWVVDPPGLIRGFEWADPTSASGFSQIAYSGAADGPERGDDGCDATPDSTAGFGSNGGETTSTDTAGVAVTTAGQWAERAYGVDAVPARVKVGAAQPFTANGLAGHLVTATASFECAPGAAVVRVFTFSAPDLVGLYNVIYWGDTGVLSDATITQMFESVRESAVPPDAAD
ncbi:MAG: hypothetical protein ACK5OX_02690 [Desertimonas sp.]